MPGNKELLNILHFFHFKDIDYWSANSILGSALFFNNKNPLSPLETFLKRRRIPASVQDNLLYKRLTVKLYTKGVTLRDEAFGNKIITKRQWIAKAGDFIISKIDARNGAFGIVPNELDGAIVTNDFPLYEVDNSIIITEYLHLITATKQFQDFCQSASSGTTGRQRVDEAQFLKIQIPLPTVEKQQKLVDKYNKSIVEANEAEQSSSTTDLKCKEYLNSQLGLTFSRNPIIKGLQYLHYKDTIQRWDPYITEATVNTKYAKIPVKQLLKSIATGTTPPTSNPAYFDGEVNFYTPSELSDEMYLTNSARKVSELAIKDKKARVFYKNTLLFVGIGSTVGKVGLVGNDYATSNQQITGLILDEEQINPEFAFYFFHYNKEITIKDQSKTTLPIINQTKIESIEIPLPPTAIQNSIVEYIKQKKSEVKELITKTDVIKAKAKKTFEMELFEL